MMRRIHGDSTYEMTMGRLYSAVSSVAVPLATRTALLASMTDQATGVSPCPSAAVTQRRPGTGCWVAIASNSARRCGLTMGTTHCRRGSRRTSSAAACRKRGASRRISDERLPGRMASTRASASMPSRARAAARSGCMGITPASGWPT
ncbi:Uncharacterised protein [Bordetella pertussis]|nr:Uncharacterised protein [Bordetella pertussis]CFP04950.1 Uncharacterised protein [Bordetella pertussis]CPO58176.1 Uncharacterised protein [Bordetella pertussis]